MIRDAAPSDFTAILALNAESVHFTSPLDFPRLQHLHAQAAYHRIVERDGAIDAFLLAFREGADYDSPNYRWFAREYPRFLYIDRIVVASTARGAGLGAKLYDDIIDFALRSDCMRLTCEFDLDPPNPASARFHSKYGFREVGRHRVSNGKKEVSLQVRLLAE